MIFNGVIELIESIECPHCHKTMALRNSLAGKPVDDFKVYCFDCGKSFWVHTYIWIATSTSKKKKGVK